jgi:hypothetical protein
MSFVDAEIEYFAKSLKTLETLKLDLSNIVDRGQSNTQRANTNTRKSYLTKSSNEDLSNPTKYTSGLSGGANSASSAFRQSRAVVGNGGGGGSSSGGVSRSTSSSSIPGKMASPAPPQPPYREPEPTSTFTKQVRVLFDFEAEGPAELTSFVPSFFPPFVF